MSAESKRIIRMLRAFGARHRHNANEMALTGTHGIDSLEVTRELVASTTCSLAADYIEKGRHLEQIFDEEN